MSSSTARVQSALEAAGSSARVLILDTSARTAVEAAASLGVEVGQIVKSLVFVAGGSPLVALVAGDRRADTEKLVVAAGRAPVRMATADVVRAVTGFAIGGVAPLGYPDPLETVIDESLSRFSTLWAAAGAPEAVFETSLTELMSMTGGVLHDIS